MCWFYLLISMISFVSIVYSQNSGDIRLVGGLCRMRGRLEVFANGEWGTVCDNNFDYKDAMVVCRQLGASSWGKAHIYTAGDGRGRIWTYELSCAGYEANILNCNREYGQCSHAQDVGVWCFEAEEGDLRLVGSSSITSGRLEIFHSGKWGTICDDKFDQHAAVVACRQLKLGTASLANVTGGSGTIWLDELSCGGHESSIDKCSHNGWGRHDCSHSEDVAITCTGTYQPIQGDLRLVGGTGYSDGRLEVFYSGSWGTVCDDEFDKNDARVACRQLGYRSGLATFYTAGNGEASQYTNLDDLGCTGNEDRLDSCTHPGWRIEDCGHYEDIGIRCHEKCIVDGSWGQWTTWTYCSASCGSGTRVRNRACDDPPPSSDGLNCTGEKQERQDCQSCPCPVIKNISKETLMLPIWTFAVIVTSIIVLTALISSTAMFIILRRRYRKGKDIHNASNPEEHYELPDAEDELYETCN